MQTFEVFEGIHLSGLVFSTLGLIFQILIYVLIPCSRKLDQKLLTQLTVARLFNAVAEYTLLYCAAGDNEYLGLLLYSHSDCALACWMFVFTKNLYDKVINVFTEEYSFVRVSVIIWIGSFLTSPLIPVILVLERKSIIKTRIYFKVCQSYAVLKLIVFIVNVFMFLRVFALAVTRPGRNVGLFRFCVISLVLFSISSAQSIMEVCIMHLIAFISYDMWTYWRIISFINSYQSIAITGIFVILAQGACEGSLFETVARKLRKEMI